MRIMWITNIVIGSIYEKLYGKKSNGVWMEVLLNDFISNKEHQLVVVTTGRNKDIIYLQENMVGYYILPGGEPINYKPAVIYIQGILEAISRYYEAGIEHKELIQTVTFRDLVKRDSILQQKDKYIKRAKNEKEMLELAGNIICENLWCKVHCQAIVPNIETHYCQLSINEIFGNYKWCPEKMKPYTVMCNASGYPLKGLHIIMMAIRLVKREYPNVKLYVPGTPMVSDRSLKSKIRKNGYTKYIENLIKKLDISGNIEFMGNLSAEDMAYNMSMVNVFVLGSAIENHSSTLKEAMMVGTPCISSIVGGAPEYAIHEENALLYRFEEYELLAEYICRLFGNRELAIKLSNNARNSAIKLNDNGKIYDKMVGIYEKILMQKRCEKWER